MADRPDDDLASSPSVFVMASARHHVAAPSFLPGHGVAVLPADALLLGFFLILLLQYRHRVQRRRRAWLILRQLITLHQHTLAQRQQDCLTQDHYGVVHKERWDKELEYFCQNVLLARLRQEHLAVFWPVLRKRTLRRIQRVIKAILKRSRAKLTRMQDAAPPTITPGATPKRGTGTQAGTAMPSRFSNSMDPLDYERFCAGLLQRASWQATPTPPGSDQGVDILAEKEGKLLVVQCKLYSRPVGNKAVQEIFTARQHRHAHYAIVVSNAGYTRPARQLAHATGVQLMHHSQLSTLTLADLQPAADLL